MENLRFDIGKEPLDLQRFVRFSRFPNFSRIAFIHFVFIAYEVSRDSIT